MEKNKKFEYINRENGIVTLHYISYEESRNKAIKSLDGIDERLLNDVDFIKSIAKETKDKMLWVKIGRELKKNVDICAISLLREFIDWNQVEPELKKDKRVLCAAAYNFKNQELFESYGVSRSSELLAYILERPKMPLHINIVKHWVKNDKIMEIIVDRKPYFYKNASPKIRRNIKIAKKVLKEYPHYLGLEVDLWTDPNVAKDVVNEFNINYAKPEIQLNHDLLLPIIKKNPTIIYSLCEDARNDPLIVTHGIFAAYMEEKNEYNLDLAKMDYKFNKFLIGSKLLSELTKYSNNEDEQVDYLIKLINIKELEKELESKIIINNNKKIKVKL